MARDDAAVAETLVARLEGDLKAVEARVRPGFAADGGPANRPHRSRSFLPRKESRAAAVERLGDDLDRFRSDQKLDTVIVVNVALTEPPVDRHSKPRLRLTLAVGGVTSLFCGIFLAFLVEYLRGILRRTRVARVMFPNVRVLRNYFNLLRA